LNHCGSIGGAVLSPSLYFKADPVGLDGHYIFLSIIGIFALSVIEAPGPIVKTLLATLLITGLVIPITRQFLLPALPVITWAVLFYSARYLLSFYIA
jgi:hypothetical protein